MSSASHQFPACLWARFCCRSAAQARLEVRGQRAGGPPLSHNHSDRPSSSTFWSSEQIWRSRHLRRVRDAHDPERDPERDPECDFTRRLRPPQQVDLQSAFNLQSFPSRTCRRCQDQQDQQDQQSLSANQRQLSEPSAATREGQDTEESSLPTHEGSTRTQPVCEQYGPGGNVVFMTVNHLNKLLQGKLVTAAAGETSGATTTTTTLNCST